MIKSCFEEDFKKKRNAWLWRDVSHRATTDDTKEAHTNSCLSSTLIFVSSRAKTNLIQTTVYQFSFKILSINSDKLLSINASIFVSWRAKWLETTLIQALVSQLSYKRLSLNSHTNSCLSTLIHTECVSILIQTLVYINSHTNSCLSTLIFVSSRARWIETNSHTNSCLSTLIQVRTLLY